MSFASATFLTEENTVDRRRIIEFQPDGTPPQRLTNPFYDLPGLWDLVATKPPTYQRISR